MDTVDQPDKVSDKIADPQQDEDFVQPEIETKEPEELKTEELEEQKLKYLKNHQILTNPKLKKKRKLLSSENNPKLKETLRLSMTMTQRQMICNQFWMRLNK